MKETELRQVFCECIECLEGMKQYLHLVVDLGLEMPDDALVMMKRVGYDFGAYDDDPLCIDGNGEYHLSGNDQLCQELVGNLLGIISSSVMAFKAIEQQIDSISTIMLKNAM